MHNEFRTQLKKYLETIEGKNVPAAHSAEVIQMLWKHYAEKEAK